MQIILPSTLIMSEIIPHIIYNKIEDIARTCYKSESKGDSKSFVGNIVKRGHLAMIEHVSVSVRFLHNRGFSHELVRHRIASFAQESTRYCNYSQNKFGNELTFIKPYWFSDDDVVAQNIWLNTMQSIENSYLELCGKFHSLPAQAIRGILPNDLKTEIVITANLREWINIFKLRCADDAHPDMRRVMIPLKNTFIELLPEIFGELNG